MMIIHYGSEYGSDGNMRVYELLIPTFMARRTEKDIIYNSFLFS